MANLNIKLPFHSVFLVLAVGIPLWVIGLAGFSAVTSKCNDRVGFTSEDCGQDNALEWFSIWFELAILLLLAGFTFLSVLAKLKPAILTFLAIATVLFINHSNYYVRQAYFNESALKLVDTIDAVRAAAAGAVLLTIFNFVVILYISWLDEASPAPATIETRPVDIETGEPVPAKAVDQQPTRAVSATADA